MTRLSLIVCMAIFIIPSSCSNRSSNSTIKVVKPKYHHRWFDRKKDKRAVRTKTIRMVN